MRVRKEEEIQAKKLKIYSEKKLKGYTHEHAGRVKELERELEHERRTIKVFEKAEERLLG